MPHKPSWGWNDNFPMVRVKYHEAMEYCEWLTEVQGSNYRLPTEAEWEYAARGGNKSQGYEYSGSNDLYEAGWFNENSGDQTQEVGSLKPNELGLYDMSGNAWELCYDWFGYYDGNAKTNPGGPENGNSAVVRGGSWRNSNAECRVTKRNLYSFSLFLVMLMGERRNDQGFRVVSSLQVKRGS
jgi:sulfatase modifying factor 1